MNIRPSNCDVLSANLDNADTSNNVNYNDTNLCDNSGRKKNIRKGGYKG